MKSVKAVKKRDRPVSDGRPLAEKAYSAVRLAIDSGDLEAGAPVSEYQVARWLNISRTPAREALRRLQLEGLLSQNPQRGGLVVVTIDEESLRQLYEARELVEATLSRLAAKNASGPQIGAILRMVDIESTLSRERMYTHNREFHELIYQAAHNSYLAKSCISLHDVIATDARGSNLGKPDRCEAILREHRAMADAIAARDGERAADAAVEHIRGAYVARLQMRRPANDG